MNLYSAKFFTKFGYYGDLIYLDWTLTVLLKLLSSLNISTTTFMNIVC